MSKNISALDKQGQSDNNDARILSRAQPNGYNLLTIIKNNDAKPLVKLIEITGNVDIVLQNWTPLNAAVHMQDIDVVSEILSLGANINKRNEMNCGKTRILEMQNIYENYIFGDAPIEIAVDTKNLEMIKLLHRNGADIHTKNPRTGLPIIHKALAHNELDIIKFLITEGVNPNEVDNCHRTPLIKAIIEDQYEAAKLLLNHGAHVNTSDNQGNTPLYEAIKLTRDLQFIELLLEHNADTNSINNNHHTPLHCALHKVLEQGFVGKQENAENESIITHQENYLGEHLNTDIMPIGYDVIDMLIYYNDTSENLIFNQEELCVLGEIRIDALFNPSSLK